MYFEIFPSIVSRSFDDVVNDNIFDNYKLLFSGFFVMFLYVIVMLGKFNMVEHRVWLSLAGLTGIILGSVFGVGFCSIFGLVFTDLHNVLPFLMLGVGIDDMFVLVKGYDNLSEDEKNLPLPERFAKTLSVSGMAVSVSSVTNIVAFSIGATTVIPALRSFCLYCSVGIMAIFIYTLTFFTACMVIDQKRIDERRDGCLCCYKHGDSWSPNNATNIEQPNFLFTKFVKFSTYRLTKIFVIMLTLGYFCVACYGISRLEQRNGSAERMLIPDDSYLAKWFDDRMKYFNDKGERGTIYVADFAMNSEQLDRVSWLVRSLANQTDIISEVDNWALGFSRFYDRSMNSSVIKTELGKYLHSPQGLRFRDRFEFSRDRMPECNEETPEVLMFKIEYQHPLFSGPMEHVPALNRVKQIMKDANITGRVFTKSNEFWEVDEIFSDELIRSISLALVCVFLIVIFMLANVTGAVLVLISVMFTIADVMGFMYFWEVTIDSTAGMLLILCVGLR